MTRLIALVGILGISFSAIFVALSGASASAAGFLRMAYALPFLVLLTWRSSAVKRLTIGAAAFSLAAGVAFVLNLTAWHYNIHVVGVGLSTAMGNSHVLFIGVFAWVFFRERPTQVALIAMPLMFLGLILISGIGPARTSISEPALGAILGTLNASFYAVYFLLYREAMQRSNEPSAILLLVTASGFVTALIVSLVDGGLRVQLPLSGHLWLLALALVAQVAGWRFISPALKRLPALEIASLMLLQPSLTIVWGYLIFGENHSVLQWIGVALLFGGLGLFNGYGVTDAKTRRLAREMAEADC